MGRRHTPPPDALMRVVKGAHQVSDFTGLFHRNDRCNAIPGAIACSAGTCTPRATLTCEQGQQWRGAMRSKLMMTAAAAGASLFLAMAPAQAQHWHGGGWRGAGAGFAAGAIVGSAIGASGYYYGPYGYGYGGSYGPDYASDYDPYYPAYGDTYVFDDAGYAEGGLAVASGYGASYCAQRYRSYNPRTGTYLSYDGRRHRCP
jgi:hypothetical protein